MTRRQILSLPALAPVLALSGLSLSAQAQQYRGMASRGVAPTPRGKPSGLPFNAKFVNVAAASGLTAPVIYGDEGRDDYILESMGC
ncbi:MAG: CRTAC1 family protein, partial [Terriglobia bacterium]